MQNNSGIIKQSVRYTRFEMAAGEIHRLDFSQKHTPDRKPNVFQIRNLAGDTCFLSKDPYVSDTVYEIGIVKNGTRVYVIPQGITVLYVYATGSGDLLVNSMYAENVQPYDLDETSATTIINNVLTEAVEISKPLPEGSNIIGKVDINSVPQPKTPVNIALPMPLANHEYQINLIGVKRLQLSLRNSTGAVRYRISYEAGKVATPTDPYYQYSGDIEYFEENIDFTGVLYIAVDTAGQTAQILAWT